MKPVPDNWQEVYLKALCLHGNVSKAATSAKVSRKFVYNQRETDAEFATAWVQALEQAADCMEAEAWRRAVKGTRKPVYQGGKKVGVIQEYSDTLLIFMLKGARPEKYRERYDVNQRGAQIQIDWTTVPADLRDAFIDHKMSLDDVLRELQHRNTGTGTSTGSQSPPA